MRKHTWRVSGPFLSLAMIIAMSSPFAAQQVTLQGSGSGSFEAPSVVNNGAVAYAQCVFDRTAQTISCTSRVYNIVDLIAAHLHVGGPGTSGPVIIPIPNLPLHISAAWGQSWTWGPSDVLANPATGINAFDDILQACVAGNCYLNWHTTASPGGALRVNLCPPNRATNIVNNIAVCVQQGQ